jgi:drug/metabolite transporter (DMT)-like permease
MDFNTHKTPSTALVVFAFAVVYLVWGSTYFFIRVAIQDIPALLMVCLRFMIAGLLLLTWCILRGEKPFIWANIRPAVVSGLLLLFLGNGAVVWAEQYLASSLVAVFTAASPIWFVVLDKRNWGLNFRRKETVIGLAIGFAGVILLFSEHVSQVINPAGNFKAVSAMGILVIGSACWAGGSLYSKYHSKGPSHSVNTAWQMIAAGVFFLMTSGLKGEWGRFHPVQISAHSWLALDYLISLGSLAGYSAYAWLLQVRPATQVSTHAYVNPIVAVILGTWLASEKLSILQIAGLTTILASVLLINLSRYRKVRRARIPGNAGSPEGANPIPLAKERRTGS